MAGQYVLPVYIRAFNQLSAPMQAMQSSLSSFTEFADAANKKLTIFGDTTQKIGGYVKSFALMGAGVFAGKAIADYDQALSKFRIIVDDLTDEQFEKYKVGIRQVAISTKSSAVDVANAFANIAEVAPEFANTVDGINAMAKAAITLSRASGESLPQTAEELTVTMQQYGLAADQANRVINSMAAGQAAGAASVQNITEAMKNFGATARSANMTIEQSVALVEALASRGLVGEEAGTGIKSAIVHLQAAGLGYQSGKFNISDAIEEATKKLNTFHTEMQKDAYIQKLFGVHQINTGRTILGTADVFAELTGKVTGTTEAYKQAAIQQGSLYASLQRIADAFSRILTSSSGMSNALKILKGILDFVASHMNMLFAIGELIIAFKVIMGVMRAYKAIVAAVTFVQTQFAHAIEVMNLGLAETEIAAQGASAAMIAMSSVGVIAAIAAIGGLVYWLGKANEDTTELASNTSRVQDEFSKLKRPVTEAQIALQRYVETKNKLADVQGELIRAKAEREQGNYISAWWMESRARGKMMGLSSELNNAPFDISNQASSQQYVDSLKRIINREDSAYQQGGKHEVNINVKADPGTSASVTSNSDSSVMPITFKTFTR